MCHPHTITLFIQVPSSNVTLTICFKGFNSSYICVYLSCASLTGYLWMINVFPLSPSPSLCHSSLPPSPFFSLRKTKTRSSHSDREQRKTWPGPVTFEASSLVEACCVSFVAVWTARQAVLWALPWTQSYLSSPVRADLHRRLRADFFHCGDTFCGWMKRKLSMTAHVTFSD